MNEFTKSRLNFFLYFIGQQKFLFFLVCISCLSSSLSTSLWPVVTGELTDAINEYAGDKHNVFIELSNTFILVIGFWILLEVLTRFHGIVLAFIYPRIEANIRMQVFKYVNQHSHSYFISNFVGSISTRLNDLPRSTSIIVDFIFNNLIPLIVSIIISSSIFFQIDSRLALILFSWLTVHLVICAIGGNRAAQLSKEHSDLRSLLHGKITDSFINHLNVKLYSKHDYEVRNITESQNNEKLRNSRTLFYMEKLKLVLGILAFFSVTGIMYLTINFWQREIITLGDVVFIMTTILNLMSIAWTAAIEMSYLFRELGVIGQALKIVQDPLEISDSKSAKTLKIKEGKIEFKKVSFKYTHNNNVFKDKSLTIKGGQKIGLVGFSGSGKTTFVNLILRLFDLTSGKILIDGQDIKKVKVGSLRDNITLIPQEPHLFNRSIFENIQYSKEDATYEEVIEASKKAHCHEFIMNLEFKYDSIVGEMGSKISGGQRQRIAIARAILKNAPILIMDEATSALDSHTEKYIQESIGYLSKNKTTIIIAHRLSTLLKVDRILVFHQGTIIEDGSHDELIKNNGHYAMLWRMQTAGILPDSLDQ